MDNTCTYLALLAALATLVTIVNFKLASAQENLTDEMTIKGNKLTGKILQFDSSGIQFQTSYGKGTIVVNYSDVEQIYSLMVFHIIKETGEEFRGYIYGISDQYLVVGISRELVQKVAIEDIRIGVPEFEFDRSFLTRLRYRYRYWRGSLDLLFHVEQGAVDKRKIEFGLNANRRKSPTRFLFDFRYRYEIESAAGTPEITTKDEYTIFLLGEYDIARDYFIFALPAAERDIPRGIEKRYYPATGIGYRLTETANALLQAQVGIAYVYEKYNDFGNNDYLAAHLGIEARYKFKNESALSGRIYYYPSFSGLGDDWLFRGDLDLTVPLHDFVALIFRIYNVNDDNPSPEVGNNKLTTSLGLSLTF